MNPRQRAVVSGTLKIAGLFLLGFWLGGILFAVFGRITNPFWFLVFSVAWGLVGLWAAATVAGWPALVILVGVVGWFYIRAGRVAAN